MSFNVHEVSGTKVSFEKIDLIWNKKLTRFVYGGVEIKLYLVVFLLLIIELKRFVNETLYNYYM